MIIQIEALDTLFFRDGKPFEMGDDTWASGIFPPPPSVFYGAICSAYATQNGISNPSDIKEATKNLIIKGIYLHDNGVVYLPLPLDLVQKKNKSIQEKQDENDDRNNGDDYISLVLLQENTIRDFCSSNQNKLDLLSYSEEVEAIEDGLLSFGWFCEYLKGNINNIKAKAVGDFVFKEQKIGIQRTNETHISEDGKLYRIGMNRLGRLKLCIEFEGLKITNKGLLKLGGEGKIVKYDNLISEDSFRTNYQVSSLYFKLVLKTPSIFEQGWLPKFVDGNKIKLKSACIGKPLNIGGFDMVAREPKYMRKAVPAGSVYYLEVDNEHSIKEIFSKHSISENFEDIDYQKQGFGLYELATLNH